MLAKRPARVRLEFGRLTQASAGVTGECQGSEHALRVLVGSGRASMLRDPGMPTVLVPVRGYVTLIESDATRILPTGRLLSSEGGNRTQAVGSGDSLWIAVVAPVTVWRALVDGVSEQTIPAPVLLPATHPADRTIRRAAVRLARAVRGRAASAESEIALLRFVLLLLDLQSAFDPLILRCPGRTLAQRRGVFLRLQRVCNYMESSSDLDLGIAGFARVANYSPCHFLRTFNSVYGKTPHAVLVEQRLKRARRLVNTTALSIAEVARASGFESRCAFARSFKRRFGETATAVRERRLVAQSVCE